MSNRSGPEDADMGAAEDVGGRTSMEQAEGGGLEEGDAAVATTAVANVAEEVHEDDPYANVDTPACAAQTDDPVENEQVN